MKPGDRVQVVGSGGYRGYIGTLLKINGNIATIRWDKLGIREWSLRGPFDLEVIVKKCPMALTGKGEEV